MNYDPKAIANFFLAAAAADGKRLTPLQVIKLVYISHGWYLGFTGQPLINEPPQAWQYGPVIRSLYHDLKIYGNEAVLEPLTRYANEFQTNPLNISWNRSVVEPPTDPSLVKFLNSVWNAYKGFTGGQLSTMTHQPGTPWQKTWDELGAKYAKGVEIPEDMIRTHYCQLRSERTSSR